MIKEVLIFTISVYQKTFSKLGTLVFERVCCFEPTCSEYSKKVIAKYSLGKGIFLSLRRLSKCHPWSKTYIDPVP